MFLLLLKIPSLWNKSTVKRFLLLLSRVNWNIAMAFTRECSFFSKYFNGIYIGKILFCPKDLVKQHRQSYSFSSSILLLSVLSTNKFKCIRFAWKSWEGARIKPRTSQLGPSLLTAGPPPSFEPECFATFCLKQKWNNYKSKTGISRSISRCSTRLRPHCNS